MALETLTQGVWLEVLGNADAGIIKAIKNNYVFFVSDGAPTAKTAHGSLVERGNSFVFHADATRSSVWITAANSRETIVHVDKFNKLSAD